MLVSAVDSCVSERTYSYRRFALDALNDWRPQKFDAERGELKYVLATNRTTRNDFGNPTPSVGDKITRLGLVCRLPVNS